MKRSGQLFLLFLLFSCFNSSLFASSTEAVIYDFSSCVGASGCVPNGAVVFDGQGNLYGAASFGANERGVVYELSPAQGGVWTESVLYSFCPVNDCADGDSPNGALVFDTAGNLYGTTATGGGGSNCGVVFELSPGAGTWTETVLHTFAGPDGCNPTAGVVLDASGNVYGTTGGGGAYHGRYCSSSGCGTAFELSAGTWTESVLFSFGNPSVRGKTGLTPASALIFDATGNVYGLTEYGGNSGPLMGFGIVFRLAPNANGPWTETVIHNFRDTKGNGFNPNGNLVFDPAGNLYGTTLYAADHGSYSGIVFKLKPTPKGAWDGSVIHTFGNFKNGVGPTGLTFDAKGNLYGTTGAGGGGVGCKNGGCGTAFELSLVNGKWSLTVLHSFQGNGQDGNGPSGALILDASGNLYGTTELGGTGCNGAGCGTVFELTP